MNYRGFEIEKIDGVTQGNYDVARLAGRSKTTRKIGTQYLIALPGGGTKMVSTQRMAREYIDNYMGEDVTTKPRVSYTYEIDFEVRNEVTEEGGGDLLKSGVVAKGRGSLATVLKEVNSGNLKNMWAGWASPGEGIYSSVVEDRDYSESGLIKIYSLWIQRAAKKALTRDDIITISNELGIR